MAGHLAATRGSSTSACRCWCGGGPAEVTFRTSRFSLVECPSCGCFRIDPPPLVSEAAAPDFYTQYYAARQRVDGTRHAPAVNNRTSRFWRVAAHSKQLYRIGRVAVDVGCGDGRLCAELKAAGWPTVLGLDASRTRIESARRSHPGVQFQAQPIAEAELVPDSVDLMVLDNILEHLPNPRAALSRLRSFLHPNGTGVIITPNMRSGHFRLLGRRWTPELAPHAHVFLFTPASLARLLSDVGLELTAAGTLHLPFYSWRDWLEPLLLGELKVVAWRAAQEAGGLYGRLLGAGPMQYVVVRRSGVAA